MSDRLSRELLNDIRHQFHRHKTMAEKAVAQVSDDHFFLTLDKDGNSVALLLKHIAGNLRSRWTDFLVSDGEKADRQRDTEFEQYADDTRARIMERWDRGWQILFESIDALRPEDLDRTIRIRSEPHSVVQALHRALLHYAYHIGQIVLLARHYAGDSWQTLSVARGQSEQFRRAMELKHGEESEEKKRSG